MYNMVNKMKHSIDDEDLMWVVKAYGQTFMFVEFDNNEEVRALCRLEYFCPVCLHSMFLDDVL